MTNTLYRTALGSIALSMVLFTGHAFAQSPPTATEAFNLRIKCKKMSDEKAASLSFHEMTVADGAAMGLMSPAAVAAWNDKIRPEVVASWNTSKYDPINNRCYGRVYSHNKKENPRYDNEYDQVYDLQTDDLLASAMIKDGKKSGNIWDPDPEKRYPVYCMRMGGCPPNSDLTWQAAEDYMNELMAEPRK